MCEYFDSFGDPYTVTDLQKPRGSFIDQCLIRNIDGHALTDAGSVVSQISNQGLRRGILHDFFGNFLKYLHKTDFY